jgi:hypothetical protein
MSARYKDLCSGLFLTLLGFAFFISSFGIPRGAEMGVGADFMPKVLSVLLLLLGGLITLQARNRVSDQAGVEKAPDAVEPPRNENGRSLPLSLLYLALFIVLLDRIGFIVMTFLYAFFQILLFAPREKRNYILFGIIAAVLTILVYFIFVKGFKMMLPGGILG